MSNSETIHRINNEIAKISGLCRTLEIGLKNLSMDDGLKAPLLEKTKTAQVLLLKLSEQMQTALIDKKE